MSFPRFSQQTQHDTHRERNRKNESGGSRGKGERSVLILCSQPNHCNGTSFMWNLATWRSLSGTQHRLEGIKEMRKTSISGDGPCLKDHVRHFWAHTEAFSEATHFYWLRF